jgi:chemotaxis signal transduction protein
VNAASGSRELYCLLVPLVGRKLLLPREIIVEVMGVGALRPAAPGAPVWHLGWRAWQDRSLPVVSLEAYYGGAVPPQAPRSRLVCALGLEDDAHPYYAFVTRGYPYLVRVTETVLRPDPEAKETPGLLAQIRFGNDRPVVPDLARLERDLAGLAPP